MWDGIMRMSVTKGTPRISFVIYAIKVECMCDASYLIYVCKICNFREKHLKKYIFRRPVSMVVERRT